MLSSHQLINLQARRLCDLVQGDQEAYRDICDIRKLLRVMSRDYSRDSILYRDDNGCDLDVWFDANRDDI